MGVNMVMLPDIIPSIGDIEKLGVEYSTTSNDALPHELCSFSINNNEAISIHARVTKASPTTAGQHFAHFQTVAVFNNEAGVVSQKGESSYVVLRGSGGGSANTKVYFDIVGTTVRVMVQNTLAIPIQWIGIIAVIKI